MRNSLVVSVVLGLAMLAGGYAIGNSWLSGAGFGFLLHVIIQELRGRRKDRSAAS